MRSHRVGSIVSLVRQGLALEIGFGTQSVEALVWVAETIEEAVYAPGSLVEVGSGVAFSLANPPLRVGAFRALRLLVDGRVVEPASVRFRRGVGDPWRLAASVSEERPAELRPGQPTELAVAPLAIPRTRRLTVRLELESVAIPPLVWVEFTDAVGAAVEPR